MQIQFAKHPLLEQALYIINRLQEAGHAAYFVGGAVRDVLLGRSIQDVDIATSALPEETLELFPKAFATGLQHGTVTVVHNRVNYEVTTFRVEANYVDYRRPEQVEFVKQLKLDLARRDFTMNAMAINAAGDVIDYFDGFTALQAKVLVAVGEAELRFQEDALRMLRAVRFASTYDLMCDEKVWKAITKCRALLAHVSMERITQELFKLMKHKQQISSLTLLEKSTLLFYTKKELHLASHLKRLFSDERLIIEPKLKDMQLLWTMLYAQSTLSLEQIREDFTSLVFPKRMSEEIRTYIEWYRFWQTTGQALKDDKLAKSYLLSYEDYRLLYKYISKETLEAANEQVNIIATLYWIEQALINPTYYATFNVHYISSCVPSQLSESVKQLYTSVKIKKLSELNITGKELAAGLNIVAGPWLKQALRYLFLAVNLEYVKNEKDQLHCFVLQLRIDGVL